VNLSINVLGKVPSYGALLWPNRSRISTKVGPGVAGLVQAGRDDDHEDPARARPGGRRIFKITPRETIELAGTEGLHPILNHRTDSSQEQERLAAIVWTMLSLVKATVSAA
jgi:hypothetical protein